MKTIVCLDLEGVLVPEIWIAVARKTKIKALTRTTRDEPNYNKLMRFRIDILKKNKIKLKDIQRVISTIKPLPGAKTFLKKLAKEHQIIILSDTFYEFAEPLMRQLHYPTLFCNFLNINSGGYIHTHRMRQQDGKCKAVQAMKKLNMRIQAAGDSYNDISMLKAAHRGILFKPPSKIVKQFPKFPVTHNYDQLTKRLNQWR